MKREPLFRHKILELLAEGHTMRGIAVILGRTVPVIRQTVYLMRQDVKAKTTIELVVRYREGRLPKTFLRIRGWLRYEPPSRSRPES